MVKDPGKIIGGPGREGPPDFVKVEPGEEGWPSKWIGLEEARESDVPDDVLALLEALDEKDFEGLLLPAVQSHSEQLGVFKVKFSEQLDRIVESGAFEDFDNLLFLDPQGEQAGGFIKIGDIKGESQDTPDVGAWSPLSDFSDDLLF